MTNYKAELTITNENGMEKGYLFNAENIDELRGQIDSLERSIQREELQESNLIHDF